MDLLRTFEKLRLLIFEKHPKLHQPSYDFGIWILRGAAAESFLFFSAGLKSG